MSIVAKKIWLAALPLLTVVMLVKAAQPQATTTISELMTRIIQPNSDAVFYVSRFPPENDAAWRELENKTLLLAESANLLLIPGYSRDSEQWLRDAILMRDASVRAVAAARARDMETLVELNNDLYESCESCHEATR
jgi:hypothetical protein